jgi:hypothetical protein
MEVFDSVLNASAIGTKLISDISDNKKIIFGRGTDGIALKTGIRTPDNGCTRMLSIFELLKECRALVVDIVIVSGDDFGEHTLRQLL